MYRYVAYVTDGTKIIGHIFQNLAGGNYLALDNTASVALIETYGSDIVTTYGSHYIDTRTPPRNFVTLKSNPSLSINRYPEYAISIGDAQSLYGVSI